MAYEPPECECGNPLALHVQETKSKHFAVNKKGKRGKTITSVIPSVHHVENLICESCRNIYSIHEDEKGRIIRGMML